MWSVSFVLKSFFLATLVAGMMAASSTSDVARAKRGICFHTWDYHTRCPHPAQEFNFSENECTIDSKETAIIEEIKALIGAEFVECRD
ncbi:hypothetical protein CpipJ_CPIJ015506 [Culex quinquefasciatus]|uniref:Uncharacterized protein n=1 Tax=Culex quinquefasciatus TaxID=7176 RepID=B0X9Q4_CULQU|nr:hypothetical protein CpipJ_CPIJ015506 [Culex quinquefasciatus]|eukprot:XP_001866376.1 hypothetical protein CpipJ_CPIJ015506 [Culex quinquefasciatus]